MNKNFEDSKLYPISFTELIKINKDSIFLLEQTDFFKTVKIKLSINNEFEVDEANINKIVI